MAGAVTHTEEIFRHIKKVRFDWTSDGAGAVSGFLTETPYTGKIEALVTVPSGGGTAPTDLYDVTVLDEDGIDVLAGAGANRAAAATQQVLSASLGVVAYDKLQLVVANAGAAKQGAVILHIRP